MTRKVTHHTTTKHTIPHKTHTVGQHASKPHIINIAQTRSGTSAGSSAKRGSSHTTKNTTTIRRGLITGFDNSNYTADVLLLEATNTYLVNVPIAFHCDGTSTASGNLCAVLFFDEQNYTDATILAIFPNVNQGAPLFPPGRLTITPPYNVANSVVIASGTTNTYTLSEPPSVHHTNIPQGALAALIKAYFTSASAGSYVEFNQHGVTNSGFTIGNLPNDNGFLNGSGIVPMDSSGKIDVKANNDDCTVTFYTYGYLF